MPFKFRPEPIWRLGDTEVPFEHIWVAWFIAVISVSSAAFHDVFLWRFQQDFSVKWAWRGTWKIADPCKKWPNGGQPWECVTGAKRKGHRATGPQGQGCSSWIYGILQPWGSSSGTSGKWKTWPAWCVFFLLLLGNSWWGTGGWTWAQDVVQWCWSRTSDSSCFISKGDNSFSSSRKLTIHLDMRSLKFLDPR